MTVNELIEKLQDVIDKESQVIIYYDQPGRSSMHPIGRIFQRPGERTYVVVYGQASYASNLNDDR